MKYTGTLLLLFAGWIIVTLTQQWRGEEDGRHRSRIPNYSWSEMSVIFSLERDLDQRVERLSRFRERHETVKAELKARKTTLREAAGFMASTIRELNPEVRETLDDRYPGWATEEQGALWLMRHLMDELASGELKEEVACQIECLRGELRDWLGVDDPEPRGRGSW